MNRLALGIDLGGTRCRGGLVDAGGQLLLRDEMPTSAPGAFLLRFLTFCQALITHGRQQGMTITHVGVGVPGVVEVAGRVVDAPNLPELDGIDLARHLSTHLELPVAVFNDVDVIAVGEARCGAGRDIDNFLVTALGTGVGGGLILNRRLWRGARTSTVELGHIVAVPDGRVCACGQRGCLEAYASGLGLAHSVQLALDSGAESALDGVGRPINGSEVAVAAREGDAVALAAYAEAGQCLGRVLAGVVNLLGLDTILFAGSGAASFDLLRPTLERACDEALFPGTPLPHWLLAELGADAGIIGAALAAADALDG